MTFLRHFLICGVMLLASATVHAEASADDIAVENQEILVQVAKDGHYTMTEYTELSATDDGALPQLEKQKITFDSTQADVEVLELGVREGTETRAIPLDGIQRNQSGRSVTLEIPFGELKSGAVTTQKIRRTSKLAPDGFFSMDFVYGFQRREKKGVVRVVGEMPLHFQTNDPHHVLGVENVGGGFEIQIRLLEPVLSVSPETLRTATQDQLRFETPRVQISSVGTWAEVAGLQRARYQTAAALDLPPLKSLIEEIKAVDSPRDRVEKTLLWMGENFTRTNDSTREPRPLREILHDKSGTATELSLLALALLHEAGVEAEPVAMGVYADSDRLRFLHMPANGQSPLPSANYFNRLALRYRQGDTWTIVDPARGLADASHPPYYFNHMWALSLGDTPTISQVSLPETGYAETRIQTELTRRKDGEFLAQAHADFHGEIANFLREIYFKDGEEGLRTYIEAFASVSKHRGFTYRKAEFTDRSSKDLHIDMTFATAEPKGGRRRKLVMPPHYLPLFSRPTVGLRFIAFPMQITETTVVNDSFAEAEEKFDCHIYGPIASIVRRVENVDKSVRIQDLVSLPASEAPSAASEDQSRLAFHARQITRCARGGEVIVVKAGKKQKTFAERARASGFRPANANAEIRLLDDQIAKDAKNEHLWLARGRALEQLGHVQDDIYIVEQLRTAAGDFQRALALKDQDPASLGEAGINAYYSGDIASAEAYHLRAQELKSQSYESLLLAGLVARKSAKFEKAVEYFASAAALATGPEEKAHALGAQAEVLCENLQRCPDALPIHAQIIELTPHQLTRLHAAAQAYARFGDLERAVKIERHALAQQEDFQPARDELLRDLIALSESAMHAGPRSTEAQFKQVQELLLEALEVDADNAHVLSLLVEAHVSRAEALSSQAPLTLARQYLAKLKEISPEGDSGYELQAHKLEAVAQALGDGANSDARLPSSSKSGH